MIYFFLTIIFFSLARLFRSVRRHKTVFDPALFFTLFFLSLFVPIALIGEINFNSLVVGFGTRFVDEEILYRTLLASSIFILIYMEVHKFIIDRIPQSRIDRALNQRYVRADLRSPSLIYLGIFFLFFGFFIRFNLGLIGESPWNRGGTISFVGNINAIPTSGMQLLQLYTALEQLALIVAGGVYISGAKTFRWASFRFIVIFTIHLSFFFIMTTERGGSLLFGLGVLCYVSLISPLFRNIKPWHLALGILIGFSINLLTTIYENVLLGGGFDRWAATGLILRGPTAVFWITAITIDWVDSASIPLREGITYLQAVGGLFPGQIRPFEVGSLSKWFVNEFQPDLAKSGIGYGFSLIAEGYLNFKLMGVVLSSFIFACFSGFIVFIRDSIKLPTISFLIYVVMFSGFYKFLQGDLTNVLSRLQYTIVISVIFVLFLLIANKTKSLIRK